MQATLRSILASGITFYFISSADSRRASCKFTARKLALNTGKQPPRGLTKEQCVLVTDHQLSTVDVKLKNQTDENTKTYFVLIFELCFIVPYRATFEMSFIVYMYSVAVFEGSLRI